MNIKGIVLADEHFGVIDADELYKEHKEIVLAYLNKLDKLDVIFIAGDFFDHILYLNEEHANRACLFMDQVIAEARRLHSKVRVVYGTESHECNQYSIFFSRYMDGVTDFKVIKTASEEELFPDVWVLYLPEEYIYNKHEFYKDFFTGEEKYQYIIGHGVINEIMVNAVRHTSKGSVNTNRAKVPTFSSSELLENCCGEVYFGHYHVNSSIQDRIFYVGSFTRWCHGEEEPKGFYEIEMKNDKFSHRFIENTLAKKFTTVTYGYENKIFKDPEKFKLEMDKVDRYTKDGIFDNVRLIMNIPEDYPNPEGLISMMGERFKGDNSVKIKITNGYVDKTKKINKAYLDETMKKYAFIFDKSMPIAEQSHQFIQTKFETDIPTERIEWHLNTKNVLGD